MTISKSRLCGGIAAGALIALAAGSAASAQETVTSWSGAPRFTNDDVTFKVRGRVLIDAVFQDVDREGNAPDFTTRNFRGRQVFLGVEGALNSQWAYKIEGGWVNGGSPSWDDVVIEFKPTETSSILIGNVKAAGLENLTSTRFTSFMDRGPFGDIGVDSYLVSVVGKTWGPNWTLTAAAQGNSINTADVNNGLAGSEERVGFTVRGTFVPVNTDFTKVHLGLSARVRDRGDEGAFNYAVRPGTNFGTSGQYWATGAVGDKDTTIAGEFALVHKNFSVQAEYANIKIDRLQTATLRGGDPDVNVGYAFVSWWPTGETRNYNATNGEFGRPKILNPTTAGGWGGVELLARYDYADGSDVFSTSTTPAARTAAALAGEYEAWTIGANYYPFGYVRFQANYTQAKIDNPAVGQDFDIDQFQLRAQLDF
jgi:phosphate-selective porin OprO/OprP